VILLLLWWDETGNSHNCSNGGVVAFGSCDGIAVGESLQFLPFCKDGVYLVQPFSISVEGPRVTALLLKEGSNGAQSVEVHEISEFAAAVVPMAVAMAADWAVKEIFGCIDCADGCVEIAANDGCGIRREFLHNSI
jgi:hypothetical protein